MTAKPDEPYSEAEADRRFSGALKRALTTPHKPNQAFVGKKAKPDSAKGRKSKKAKARRAKRG